VNGGDVTLERTARDTLTPVEMDAREVLAFTLSDGTTRRIEVLETDAELLFTTLDTDTLPLEEECGARTFYEFTCRLTVDGEEHTLQREVPTQRSFYEPWEIGGVRIWFDAVDDIFTFLTDTHGPGDRQARPDADARFAIQDTSERICPEPVHPWCPLPGSMDINRCYLGQDCWLGPYFGAAAHAGLDVNHPPGTPIWAPVDFDDQSFFDRVDGEANNNRHRGHREWPDGTEWQLQCHHMTALTVEEHTAVSAGERYADGAGVLSGYHDHSHFVFRVLEPDGNEVLLDPWILFWQMYRDIEAGLVPDRRE
jgi:hypothetical protein